MSRQLGGDFFLTQTVDIRNTSNSVQWPYISPGWKLTFTVLVAKCLCGQPSWCHQKNHLVSLLRLSYHT